MEIGRFRLITELARGGMGMVWLAEELGAGSRGRVVVKELRPELRDDPAMREMFVDEARLAARLSHTNIVRTIAVEPRGDRPFMALELLEGATLARVEKALGDKRIPLALGVRVVAAVLAGLHHAHELRDDAGRPLGVVHRDVSPNNVFLTVDGRVKLLDFGVAKSRGRATETRHGVLKGSVAYMTPDHVCGATIDRRADVFAAGILLREIVTGQRLWSRDEGEVEILKRLVARDVPVFAPRPAVPEELRAICKKAMAMQRSERFATADEMREALVHWLEENDAGGSLGDLVPLLERLAAEDRRSRSPEVVTLASSELVSVVDVETPAEPPKTKAKRSLGGWLVAAAAMAACAVIASFEAPRSVLSWIDLGASPKSPGAQQSFGVDAPPAAVTLPEVVVEGQIPPGSPSPAMDASTSTDLAKVAPEDPSGAITLGVVPPNPAITDQVPPPNPYENQTGEITR